MSTRGRGLDLDVVEDLMLHDLDWVTRIVGGEVVSIEARGRRVESSRLDEAQATLLFSTGCEATLSASRVQAEERRFVAIEGDRGEFEGSLFVPRGEAHAASSGTPGEPMDPLSSQWLDFLGCVRKRVAPENDGRVGCDALRMVERVQDAIKVSMRGAAASRASAEHENEAP